MVLKLKLKFLVVHGLGARREALGGRVIMSMKEYILF